MSDADAFDEQIAYLLERSAFYRAKGIERVAPGRDRRACR